MPYKDEAKQKEAMREINRRYRERKKKELEELRRVAVPVIIEEPYTCVSCGKKNLSFPQICYKEDGEGQIDLKTVECKKCGLINLWPKLEKMVKPERKAEAEKLFSALAK
jgi:ferredoxin-like protein FixX